MQNSGFAADEVAQVAQVLRDLAARRTGSLGDLFTVAHEDLRRVAHSQRVATGAGATMSTTALVNEAYLKLHDANLPAFADEKHFFSIAARAMRQLLTDSARARLAQKRGSGAAHEAIEEVDATLREERIQAAELIEISDALDQLETMNPRLAQVVYLRFFAGLTDAELAEVLGVAESTVRRDWLKARGWLFTRLRAEAQ